MITTPHPQDDVLLMLAGKFHVNTTRIPDLKTIYHTNKLNTQKLFDPDSYQSIKWGKVSKNPDGSYQVTHTYRARNGFGGMNKSTVTFVINSAGTKVINYWEEH